MICVNIATLPAGIAVIFVEKELFYDKEIKIVAIAFWRIGLQV